MSAPHRRALPSLSATLAAALVLASFPAAPVAQGPGAEKKRASPAVEPLELGELVEGSLGFVDARTGRERTFRDLRGRIVVLYFASTTCPFVKALEPKVRKMRSSDGLAEADVEWVAVHTDAEEAGERPESAVLQALREAVARVEEDPEAKVPDGLPYAALRRHAAGRKVDWAVAPDHGHRLARRFGALRTPHVFVVDARGVLRFSGAPDNDPAGRKGKRAEHYLAPALEALLAGNEIERPDPRPYGCKIDLPPLEKEEMGDGGAQGGGGAGRADGSGR